MRNIIAVSGLRALRFSVIFQKKLSTENEVELFILKCYYDESHIFPNEAILKHKQVACMRIKMPSQADHPMCWWFKRIYEGYE